jgi:hypothetical protein
VFLVRHTINLRDCSSRTAARTGARRQQFGKDAAAFEAGDRQAMSHWLTVVHVVEDGSRKKLAEMTADDLGHVAQDYEARAAESAMHASFLRALAKKVGTRRTVGEVFDETKLAQLWQSLSGS